MVALSAAASAVFWMIFSCTLARASVLASLHFSSLHLRSIAARLHPYFSASFLWLEPAIYSALTLCQFIRLGSFSMGTTPVFVGLVVIL